MEINSKQEKDISKLYISGSNFKEISDKLGIDEDIIILKVSEMKLKVRLNGDQLEFEKRLTKVIRDFWESDCHDVNIYQNEYGEVRSDLLNGMPKYLKTSKYLK